MIDTHAHLDLPEFDDDREEMLSRARRQGICAIITVGIDLKSSQASLKLAEQNPDVFSAVGIHPNNASKARDGDLEQITALAESELVIAIGEIGLDFYRNTSERQPQSVMFKRQLEQAATCGLPVIIHCRNAHRELLEILTPWAKSLGGKASRSDGLGVIHCFSGDTELARRYLELGFLISLPGPVTYHNAGDMVPVAREVPLEKLMVETDSPFLSPQLHRGQRNEPAYLPLVIAKIAQLRDLSPDTVSRTTAHNSINLFRMPKPLLKGVLCR